MERYQDSSYKDKLHIIRYEDLIQQPHHEFEGLGRWLGVDPSGFSDKLIQDTSIGKYQKGLSEEEVATVMETAGATMTRYGYC
jgi:hypothetical protein